MKSNVKAKSFTSRRGVIPRARDSAEQDTYSKNPNLWKTVVIEQRETLTRTKDLRRKENPLLAEAEAEAEPEPDDQRIPLKKAL